MTPLDLDKRWQRFNDPGHACPCCGMTFSGIFDIGFDHPDDWPHGDRADGQDVLDVGDDRLSSELCRIAERRFVRAVIALPLRGTNETFFFALWVAVAAADFYDYLDGLSGTGQTLPCFAGEIANALPGFDAAAGSACRLDPGQGQERPILRVTDGPLAKAAQNGISFDELLDIYAAAGQDIRPHLAAQ